VISLPPASLRLRNWWFAAALAAAVVARLFAAPAIAQPAALLAKAQAGKSADKAEQKLPEPLTREAIRELAARLTDAEVRQLLLQQLDRAAVPAPANAEDASGMVMSMDKGSKAVRERIGVLLQAAAGFPDAVGNAYDRFHEGREPGHLLKVSLLLMLGVALAWLAERIYRHALRAQRARLDERHEEGFAAASARNILRLLFDLGGLAVFALSLLAYFYALYQGHVPSRLLSLATIGAVVLFRLTALLSRFLLEPDAPALRLLPFGDAGARRLHAGVLQVAALYLVGIFPLFLLVRLGAPEDTAQAVALLVGALLVALTFATVWAIRTEVGAMLRGPGGGGPLARLVADIWPILVGAYILVVYGAIVVEALAGRPHEGRGILSLLLLILLPVVDLVLSRALHSAMTARTENGAPAAEASYEPVLRKALHIVVAVTGALMIADLWNISFIGMAERGLGERFSGEILGIAIILLLAYLLWELTRTAMQRLLAREGGLPAGVTGDEGKAAVATRLGTLLPIMRATAHGTIILVTALSVLAAIGINILPLLAGASVVGVAIAFGAQTLVRDIVSGAFFLADDAFRVGEYIEVGESKGTVEKIRLRALFLRHHRGPINILPYGEIRRLRNQSRDWVIDKLTIGITYDSNLELARKLIKKIGQELAENPEFAPKILEPLKMQGVEQFGDFAIQIRMKMKTLPGEQFVIRRKAYGMIKNAFDANGIKFAFPTVQIAGGSAVPPAVAAAASQVAQNK